MALYEGSYKAATSEHLQVLVAGVGEGGTC
jgi:hypothetical protein